MVDIECIVAVLGAMGSENKARFFPLLPMLRYGDELNLQVQFCRLIVPVRQSGQRYWL